MDSSTETTLLENQSSSAFPKKSIQKPYILTSIFILTLLVAARVTVTTVIIIRQAYPSSGYTYVDPLPSKSIQAICSFAPYKDLCISTLSSSNSTNISDDNNYTYISPEDIIFHSFQLSVNQLIHLANISNPDNIPELRDCQALLNKEVSGLKFAASWENFFSFTNLKVDEYAVLFNRVNTYQQACLDRLGESGSTVIDEIRLNVQNARKYMFNSRAILSNRDTILDNIYRRSPSLLSGFDYYTEYFDWLGFEFLIFYVTQYVFLIVLLILMLKLY